MSRELLLLYLVIGIVLAGLEIYVGKSRKANKWIKKQSQGLYL